jgi:hypothetical protein
MLAVALPVIEAVAVQLLVRVPLADAVRLERPDPEHELVCESVSLIPLPL